VMVSPNAIERFELPMAFIRHVLTTTRWRTR